MIKVRKLVKRFGLKTVLRGMDFSVERGRPSCASWLPYRARRWVG
jgi:ABC-type transporter Mla maintaining outer membrane lipid asymmetry ATPase subunit MlaF